MYINKPYEYLKKGNRRHLDTVKGKLDSNSTKAESVFSEALQSRNIHFKKNVMIGGFFVDFFLDGILCIEIDGKYHYDLTNDQPVYDRGREYMLKSQGYSVIRFSNKEVFENIENCIFKVMNTLGSLLNTPRPLKKDKLIRGQYGRKNTIEVGLRKGVRPIDNKEFKPKIVVVSQNEKFAKLI
jgi:very-short-patch-repair endonuclease